MHEVELEPGRRKEDDRQANGRLANKISQWCWQRLQWRKQANAHNFINTAFVFETDFWSFDIFIELKTHPTEHEEGRVGRHKLLALYFTVSINSLLKGGRIEYWSDGSSSRSISHPHKISSEGQYPRQLIGNLTMVKPNCNDVENWEWSVCDYCKDSEHRRLSDDTKSEVNNDKRIRWTGRTRQRFVFRLACTPILSVLVWPESYQIYRCLLLEGRAEQNTIHSLDVGSKTTALRAASFVLAS